MKWPVHAPGLGGSLWAALRIPKAAPTPSEDADSFRQECALSAGVALLKRVLRKGYAVMAQADPDGVVTCRCRENGELTALPRRGEGAAAYRGGGDRTQAQLPQVLTPGAHPRCPPQVPTPAQVWGLLH